MADRGPGRPDGGSSKYAPQPPYDTAWSMPMWAIGKAGLRMATWPIVASQRADVQQGVHHERRGTERELSRGDIEVLTYWLGIANIDMFRKELTYPLDTSELGVLTVEQQELGHSICQKFACKYSIGAGEYSLLIFALTE